MLEASKQRAIAQGHNVGIGSSFSGAQRSLDDPTFQVGEEFTFPDVYEVCSQNLGGNDVEYIFVEVAPGVEKQFYPSTFTKSVQVYEAPKTANELPKATGKRVHTLGTAADLFRSFTTVDEGMQALRNQRVKIVAANRYTTLNFNRPTQTRNSIIYTIDLVDENGQSKKSK